MNASGYSTSTVPAVETFGLSKAYGRTWALRKLNLRVEAGERVALLGPNGAGKTTLMRLLATLARPTRGKLVICGIPAYRYKQEIRRRVGVVAHRPYLYEDMTARENLEFFANLYGVADASATYGPMLEAAGLSHAIDTRVGAYSRGMQQRLSLIRALLPSPSLLLLDEPDTGLDQEALRFLESAVLSRVGAEGAQPRTVIFSTHNLELGFRLSERVIMLASGKMVYDAPMRVTDIATFRDTYDSLTGASR